MMAVHMGVNLDTHLSLSLSLFLSLSLYTVLQPKNSVLAIS